MMILIIVSTGTRLNKEYGYTHIKKQKIREKTRKKGVVGGKNGLDIVSI
jgi:hypothetical protein